MEAIREGKSLRSRRYRNRRLGEFLKELGLTEGRATGIPTIQEELKANGSSQAVIETDEERSYFLIDIPCHDAFIADKVVLNADFIKDFIKDFAKENRTQLSERQESILLMLADDDTLTSEKISQKTGVSQRTILKDLNWLQSIGVLVREGGRKEGTWQIVQTNRNHSGN